jgi:FixJ family two-component response regulator
MIHLEREVLREVAVGRLNKQIAFDLGISEITVKLHRGNVMRKMQLFSIGELGSGPFTRLGSA